MVHSAKLGSATGRSNKSMTEEVLATLHRAITIAKDRQVRRLATLKRMLVNEGHSNEDVDQAIKAWANYEGQKRAA